MDGESETRWQVDFGRREKLAPFTDERGGFYKQTGNITF